MIEEKKKNKAEESSQDKEKIKRELKRCKQERDDYLAGWRRARADFLNYKKEEEEKIFRLVDYKFRDLVLKVLPVLDEMDKAVENLPSDLEKNQWALGIIQIRKKFEDMLAKEAVERMEALGEEFDPELHEAVEMISDKNKKSGTIIEVVRHGYFLKGGLLRPARVKVIK